MFPDKMFPLTWYQHCQHNNKNKRYCKGTFKIKIYKNTIIKKLLFKIFAM